MNKRRQQQPLREISINISQYIKEPLNTGYQESLTSISKLEGILQKSKQSRNFKSINKTQAEFKSNSTSPLNKTKPDNILNVVQRMQIDNYKRQKKKEEMKRMQQQAEKKVEVIDLQKRQPKHQDQQTFIDKLMLDATRRQFKKKNNLYLRNKENYVNKSWSKTPSSYQSYLNQKIDKIERINWVDNENRNEFMTSPIDFY